MFDFTVIVKLNTKVPVKVIVAGGSALADRSICERCAFRPKSDCVIVSRPAPTQEDRGPNSHENTPRVEIFQEVGELVA